MKRSDGGGADQHEPSALDAQLIALLPAGSARAVSALLMKGASPNAIVPSGSEAARGICYPQSLGRPALIVAIELSNSDDVARALIGAGADLNPDRGSCALEFAIMRRPELCQELVEAGADVNFRSWWGGPLIRAVQYGRLELYEALVAKGASPWRKDGEGNTAPMCAALWGELPMLSLLLARNQWEDTPRKASSAELIRGGAALEPRACALHPNAAWGSAKGLGKIAARLIDAARALRRDQLALEGEKPKRRRPEIGYKALFEKAESDGFDLVQESLRLLSARFNERDCKELREAGRRKSREWAEHALREHPAWRLDASGARRLVEAVEANPKALGALLESAELEQSAGRAAARSLGAARL